MRMREYIVQYEAPVYVTVRIEDDGTRRVAGVTVDDTEATRVDPPSVVEGPDWGLMLSPDDAAFSEALEVAENEEWPEWDIGG